jgi:hypothetical protein
MLNAASNVIVLYDSEGQLASLVERVRELIKMAYSQSGEDACFR